MKKMLRLAALSLGLVLAATATASAQGGGGGGGMGGGMRGGRGMMAMMDSLNLTDAQKAQVDSIQKVYRAQMPQFTPGTQMSDEDRAKMREVQGKQTEAIKSILTAEQKTKFDAMMAARRQQMGQRPNP